MLTAQEDGTIVLSDRALLARASELGFVLVSNDNDFKREAAHHQRQGIPFAGVIYAHQTESVGVCVEDLTLMATTMDMPEMVNTIRYVPI